MPLNAAFTASAVIGAPKTLTLTDTSTGSDGAVTKRRVYLQKADQTYLVPDGTLTTYIDWPLASSSINIDVLDKDYALNIKVQWLNISNVSLYEVSGLYLFTLNSNQFFYGLTELETSKPNVIDDAVYYSNKTKLYCSIKEAENAVTYADIVSAQSALERAKHLISNESLFF